MAPQRDEDVRLARLAGAAGIVGEKNQIQWRPRPSWMPYPRGLTASTRTVVTEQMYKDALDAHFPGIPDDEAEDSWKIWAHRRASHHNGTLPDGMAKPPRAAAPPTPTDDEDDDLGLGRIH